MKIDATALARLAAAFAIALLAACGAETKTGSNGTGILPPSTPEPSVIGGTLIGADPFAIGTAALDTTTTTFRQDATANAGTAGLRLGMSLEAVGTVTGTFGNVPVALRDASVQSEARGPIGTVNAAGGRFTIATLTFTVDANTLWDGATGITALAPGDVVEVSGLPLADLRTILATRVTRSAAPADGRISIAARVDAFTASGFTIAGLSVPTTVVLPSPVPASGSRARVTGTLDAASGTLTGEQVTFLPDYVPAPGARVEIEGIATSVDAAGAFRLRTAGRDYDVAAPPAGSPAVTAGARVRVVATAPSSISLVPQSVVVIAPGQVTYRVTGAVSDFTSLASLRVRGEPVDLTTAVIRNGSASDIANGRRVSLVGTAGPGALRVSEATIQP